MMTLDRVTLYCPLCSEKEQITLTEKFQPSEHSCPSCKRTYFKKEKSCCIICDYADMYCLPKQQIGTCSW